MIYRDEEKFKKIDRVENSIIRSVANLLKSESTLIENLQDYKRTELVDSIREYNDAITELIDSICELNKFKNNDCNIMKGAN